MIKRIKNTRMFCALISSIALLATIISYREERLIGLAVSSFVCGVFLIITLRFHLKAIKKSKSERNYLKRNK